MDTSLLRTKFWFPMVSVIEGFHCNVYEDIEQLDEEIGLVVRMLVDAAERQLPLVQPRRPRKWKDDTLSCLCAESRVAHSAWKQAGGKVHFLRRRVGYDKL